MTRNSASTVTGPQYGEPRDMPWNVMGKSLAPTHTTSLAKALKAAHMDYDVEVWDSYGQDPLTGRQLPNAKGAQIVRPVNGELAIIGQTGRRFTPTQNRDAFAIAQPLIEQGAVISGLADFRHGGASLLVMDLQRDIELTRPDGGVDRLILDLMVKNAHDGSAALTFALTPMRFACTNAVPGALKGAERTWKISHTPNAADRQALAEQSILEAIGYQEEYRRIAQAMMDTRMVDVEFAKIVEGLVKVKPDAEGKVADRKRETQADMIGLWRNSPTLEGVRGTLWGGYNALTEYLDHYRPVKGDQKLSRAEGALEGPYVRQKLNLFRQFANAAA